jgi:putative FmdB family regulatory protein
VPLYEYRCKSCGHQFEKIQSFSAPEEKECPLCHGELEKLISAPAVQFKGSGWYVTDYAGKGGGSKGSVKSESNGSAEKPAAGSSSSSDGKASSADSKSSSSSSGSASGSSSSSSSSSKSE